MGEFLEPLLVQGTIWSSENNFTILIIDVYINYGLVIFQEITV